MLGTFEPQAFIKDIFYESVSNNLRSRFMNRSFPCFFLMMLLTIGMASSVLAQKDMPSPQPGLWMIESTTTINGVNVMVAVRAAQQQML